MTAQATRQQPELSRCNLASSRLLPAASSGAEWCGTWLHPAVLSGHIELHLARLHVASATWCEALGGRGLCRGHTRSGTLLLLLSMCYVYAGHNLSGWPEGDEEIY